MVDSVEQAAHELRTRDFSQGIRAYSVCQVVNRMRLAEARLAALDWLFDKGFLRHTPSGNIIIEQDRGGAIVSRCATGNIEALADALRKDGEQA